MLRDVRVATSVPTLRSLMVGSAIASGALAGLGFWAPSFFERHTSLGSGGGAGLAGVLILFGALGGTVAGGQITDRIRDRYEGTPMLVAGVSQFCGAALLMVTFLPDPAVVDAAAAAGRRGADRRWPRGDPRDDHRGRAGVGARHHVLDHRLPQRRWRRRSHR